MRDKLCAVRFDDVCETQDRKLFEKAIKLMDAYGVKALLGVVPQNEDPHLMKDGPQKDFWDMIVALQQRGYVIAMHGYKHVYDIEHKGMVNRGRQSEFAGHPYHVQYEKIRRGKEILESHGVKTDIFFAPSHSYDKNTLKALAANGFRFVSDGKSVKPYMQEGIKCVPCRFLGTPKTKGKTHGVFLSICHSSNWDAYPENYQRLQNYMELNKDHLADFGQLQDIPCGFFWMEKIKEKLYILYHDKFRAGLANNKSLNNLYHKIVK